MLELIDVQRKWHKSIMQYKIFARWKPGVADIPHETKAAWDGYRVFQITTNNTVAQNRR